MRILAVIPAYNEEKHVGQVVKETSKYVSGVIVVDDGSKDATATVARRSGAKVIVQENRGVGGALKTGYAAALRDGADIIVRINADGQHNPVEIPKLVRPLIEKKAKYVIGSRADSISGNMPLLRQIGNVAISFILSLATGMHLGDVTCGYRAINSKLLEGINYKTMANTFRIETEEIARVFGKVGPEAIYEVQVVCIYGDETSNIKLIRDTMRFLSVTPEIIAHRFKRLLM